MEVIKFLQVYLLTIKRILRILSIEAVMSLVRRHVKAVLCMGEGKDPYLFKCPNGYCARPLGDKRVVP